MGAVIGVVMSLMVVEHFPRLVQITRLSGHRGYIVAQTIAGLLPEYAGIGLLVGLYLAIALTVRRLAMRGELDVIEACGVSPWRWMRLPIFLAALVSALTFLNQGWLMPAGEARLNEIGHRMEMGEFGFNLEAGEFVDLGSGNILNFRGVDSQTHRLTGLFLRDKQQIFSAASGRLSMSPVGEAIVDLFDGQALNSQDGRILKFTHLRYQARKVGIRSGENRKGVDPSRGGSLDALLRSDHMRDRSVVYGRLLWALLALLLPPISLVLGKPPRREAGSVGIVVGLALLVLFLKTISPLTDGHSHFPGALFLVILTGWVATTLGLMRAEKSFGQGFVDRWSTQLIIRIGSGLRKKPSLALPRVRFRSANPGLRGDNARRIDAQPAL